MSGASICCFVCLVLSLPVSGLSYFYVLSVRLVVKLFRVREKARKSAVFFCNDLRQYVLFTGSSGSLCGVLLE